MLNILSIRRVIKMILKTYCGYINDPNKLKASASGGLATAMAEEAIANGGLVYGVAYTADFKNAEYIRATDNKSIDLLKGSKYIKAHLNLTILESVIADLEKNKSVLFIGLPCDVYALKKHLSKNSIDDRLLVCVDLICHGPTSPKVAKEYVDSLEKQYHSKAATFNVRYKNPYWKPPFLYVEFENGKKHIEPFYATNYGMAFMQMSEPQCYTCKHKGNSYSSDITIGDYHGSNKDTLGYNQYGSSVAFVHTEKGDTFINRLEFFNLYSADNEKALAGNPRYSTPAKQTAQSIAFKNNFDSKGLNYAVAKHIGIKQRIKRAIKKLIKFSSRF